MNNERINVLYGEQVKVFEKQNECLEKLSQAIDSANKIKTLNSQEENVTNIINDFNIIQDNNKKLRIETESAIKHIKSISSSLSYMMFIIIFIAMVLSGFVSGYYIFSTYIKDNVLHNEINNLKEIQSKYYEQIKLMEQYKERGFQLQSNVLIVPYGSIISDTNLGKRGIFFAEN